MLQGKKGGVPQSALVNQCVLCVDLEAMVTENGALPSAAPAMRDLSSAITGKAFQLSQKLLQPPPYLFSCCFKAAKFCWKSPSLFKSAASCGVVCRLHTFINSALNSSVCSPCAANLLLLQTCQRAITLALATSQSCMRRCCMGWSLQSDHSGVHMSLPVRMPRQSKKPPVMLRANLATCP